MKLVRLVKKNVEEIEFSYLSPASIETRKSIEEQLKALIGAGIIPERGDCFWISGSQRSREIDQVVLEVTPSDGGAVISVKRIYVD